MRVTPDLVTLTTREAVVSLVTEFPEGTTLHGAYADYGELGAGNGSARPARCAPVALRRFAVDGVDNYGSRAVVAFTPDAPGERRHVIHAPHAALVWKWARPERPAGWPVQMPAFSLGAELPIGLWHDSTSGETSWFVGFGLSSAWPVF